jgi:predicted AlkP superfamily pyrophosphatase or phosphodiesterase
MSGLVQKMMARSGVLFLAAALAATGVARGRAQSAVEEKEAPAPRKVGTAGGKAARPKLVVVIVVDQMRGDYVDKFRGQWQGGLKRLVEEGAWFRDAAYPYAATETCVGHATISTGAFPATHGIVANAWWDRGAQKMVTCTADAKAKNSGYAGGSVTGGDDAARLRMPTFSDELKFQAGGATRIVTFSLKARAAIMLGGHKGDAVTWFEPAAGAWATSNVYGTMPFIEDYAKAHPVKNEFGQTWKLSLPRDAYFYDEVTPGAAGPEAWSKTFPHVLSGRKGSTEADAEFYEQWETSPNADTYLTKLAETAVDQLGLGKSGGTDFLGVSYSSPDYVGHAYGPRSWEIQDILVRLDQDLGDLFARLDRKVGRGNYVVALSADHGVVPVPEDMERSGADAGVLAVAEVQERMETALEKFNYPKPAIAKVSEGAVYFSAGIYERLQADPAAMRATMDAAVTVPGVASVYRAEEVADRPATESPIRSALAASYFAGRSPDLFVVPKPYWLVAWGPTGKTRDYGTGHGTPYHYDQHVPVLLMGFGIRAGEYFERVTPADIAPTLAAICGITLASRDGHVLGQALARTLPPRRATTE